MKNKKFITILALSGAIANLGFATAFAIDTPATGTQVIGCYEEGGTYSLNAPATIAFASGRTTNFFNEDDAPAVESLGNLTGEDANVNASYIIVTDDRGYDPEAGADCGPGIKLSVASNGLRKNDVNGSDFDIQLGLGAASIAGVWLEDREAAASSPAILLNNVVHPDETSDNMSITFNSELDLITTDEAFSGNVYLELSDALYAIGRGNMVTEATPGFGMETTLFGQFSSWDYTGPIPTGEYSGIITFTLT